MVYLAVYGHVNLDHILLLKALPQPETTLPVQSALVRLGGTGGNIARAATALGVPTALAACVGTDFPAEHRQSLEASGLDVTDLVPVAGQTPRVWILSVPDGPQSAIIDQGVMADGVTRPRLDHAWRRATWVHFTTGNPDDWYHVAEAARRDKKRVAFDPAQELSYRYTTKRFESFLNLSDTFFCNETELAHALNNLGYADPAQLLDHVDRVVVTRGKKGVQYVGRDERAEVPACPVRSKAHVETTGAGDVFRAGLYAGLHRQRDWVQGLQLAAAASSLFLEQGGQRFPDFGQVETRLHEWKP